jgi:hypothetical protein
MAGERLERMPARWQIFAQLAIAASAPDLPLSRLEMEFAMNTLPRTVVAVGGDPDRAEFLDTMMLDANDRGVIFVEPVAQGYSRVKQLSPALVVVLSEIDDPDASRERRAFAEIIAELYADYSSYADPGFTAMRMN